MRYGILIFLTVPKKISAGSDTAAKYHRTISMRAVMTKSAGKVTGYPTWLISTANGKLQKVPIYVR